MTNDINVGDKIMYGYRHIGYITDVISTHHAKDDRTDYQYEIDNTGIYVDRNTFVKVEGR